jgi:hypothetical protein
MGILNNAHNRREADGPTRQISKHKKTRRHIGQFIHRLSEVRDNHNHKDAFMNHPSKPFIRRFVNFNGFNNVQQRTERPPYRSLVPGLHTNYDQPDMKIYI